MYQNQFIQRTEVQYQAIPHHPFVREPVQTAPDILQSVAPENYVATFYDGTCRFGHHEIMSHGKFKLSGWLYDFRQYLKRYFVEFEHGIYSYYAPNKTKLRKALGGNGKIYTIVEVAR